MQVVLFAGDLERASALVGLPPDRVVVLNRIGGPVQGVATAVSQLSFFKAAFNNVLTLLTDVLPQAAAGGPAKH